METRPALWSNKASQAIKKHPNKYKKDAVCCGGKEKKIPKGIKSFSKHEIEPFKKESNHRPQCRLEKKYTALCILSR